MSLSRSSELQAEAIKLLHSAGITEAEVLMHTEPGDFRDALLRALKIPEDLPAPDTVEGDAKGALIKWYNADSTRALIEVARSLRLSFFDAETNASLCAQTHDVIDRLDRLVSSEEIVEFLLVNNMSPSLDYAHFILTHKQDAALLEKCQPADVIDVYRKIMSKLKS